MSTAPKGMNVGHRSDQGGGGEYSDPGNLLQTHRNEMLARKLCELAIDGGDPRF
jgi:hypothetical protein